MPSELKRQRSQSPVGPLSSSELALCQSVMDAIYTEKDNRSASPFHPPPFPPRPRD